MSVVLQKPAAKAKKKAAVVAAAPAAPAVAREEQPAAAAAAAAVIESAVEEEEHKHAGDAIDAAAADSLIAAPAIAPPVVEESKEEAEAVRVAESALLAPAATVAAVAPLVEQPFVAPVPPAPVVLAVEEEAIVGAAYPALDSPRPGVRRMSSAADPGGAESMDDAEPGEEPHEVFRPAAAAAAAAPAFDHAAPGGPGGASVIESPMPGAALQQPFEYAAVPAPLPAAALVAPAPEQPIVAAAPAVVAPPLPARAAAALPMEVQHFQQSFSVGAVAPVAAAIEEHQPFVHPHLQAAQQQSQQAYVAPHSYANWQSPSAQQLQQQPHALDAAPRLLQQQQYIGHDSQLLAQQRSIGEAPNLLAQQQSLGYAPVLAQQQTLYGMSQQSQQWMPPQQYQQQQQQQQQFMAQQQAAQQQQQWQQQQFLIQQQQQIQQQQLQALQESRVAAQAVAQVQQLSVPSMLQEQMAARSRVLGARPLVPSVQGVLESDVQAAALLAREKASARSYSEWFERRAGALRGRFFDLVEAWRQAHFAVCQVVQTALDGQVRVQAALQQVWHLRSVRMEQRHVCGDGIALEMSITHAVADYSARAAEAAHEALQAQQCLAIQDLAAHRFLASSAQLAVELFLAELLGPQGLAPGVGPVASSSVAPRVGGGEGEGGSGGGAPGGMSTAEGEGHPAFAPGSSPSASSSSSGPRSAAAAGPPSADFLAQLRSVIDVLFYFEKLRDDAQESARSLWRARRRDRADQRAKLLAQRQAQEAILANQPKEQGPNAAVVAAVSAAPLSPSFGPGPAAGSGQQPNGPPNPPGGAGAPPGSLELDDGDDGFDDPSLLDSPAPAASSSPRPEDAHNNKDAHNNNGANAALAAAPLKEHAQFRQGVRRWLRISVEALYACGSYADHQYVLAQVLRCRGVTRWASMLQFQRANARDVAAAREAQRLRQQQDPMQNVAAQADPALDVSDGWAWTDGFVSHVLSCLALLLDPLEGKQLRMPLHGPAGAAAASAAAAADDFAAGAVPKRERLALGEHERAGWHREAAAEEGEAVRLGSLGPSPDVLSDVDDDDGMGVPRSRPSAAESAASPAAASGAAGAEWIVLDQNKLTLAASGNADVSYASALNESDYTDLLAQTPILPFVRSRVYPLFLRVARRHVSLHASQADAGDRNASAGDSDSAYEAFDRASLHTAFAQIKLVLSLLSHALAGGSNSSGGPGPSFPPEYGQLKKVLAKLQCQVLGLVSAAWGRSWRVARWEARRGAHDGVMAGMVPGGVFPPPVALGLDDDLDEPDDESDEDAAESAAGGAASSAGMPGPNTASHVGLWPAPCCFACECFHAVVQKHLDFEVLRLVCHLQHAPTSARSSGGGGSSGGGVRHFLSELPFASLSVPAAGQVFLALFSQAHSSDYADSSLTFQPLLLQPWLSFLSTAAGAAARTNFVALLLNEADAGAVVHTLMALTKLVTSAPYEISPVLLPPVGADQARAAVGPSQSAAASNFVTPGGVEDDITPGQEDDGGAPSVAAAAGAKKKKAPYPFRPPPTDLPLIFLHELFHQSYVNLSTRESLWKTAQGFLVELGGLHPLGISFLLFLCHQHWRFIGAGALALFDAMDLRAWRPTASCMYILQSLLLTPPQAASNELARTILARLNFDWVVLKTPSQEPAGRAAQSGRHHSRASLDGAVAARRGGSRRGSAVSALADEMAGAAAHMFFPPRPRAPVLGWQFHRSLLLMLADVRLASLRPLTGPSSGAASAPPSVPFTSFVAFPSCAWSHLYAVSSAGAGRNPSGSIGSGGAQQQLPQPPAVEQHLQQQFEQHLRLQNQQLLSPVGYPVDAARPPGAPPRPASVPAFSSASEASPMSAPAADGSAFSFAAPGATLTALLAPASAALADVFNGGKGSRLIEPSWWMRMLSMLALRDLSPRSGSGSGGAAPVRASKSWLSARWEVTGAELEEYTNIVRRDPVLCFAQLVCSRLGSEARLFARDGWPLLKVLLADATFAPLGWKLMHDIFPGLLRPSAGPSAAGGSAPPSSKSSPSSWAIVGSAGASVPHLALGPAASAAAAAAAPSRHSVGGGGNPAAEAGSPAIAGAAGGADGAAAALSLMHSVGVLRHIMEQARPKGMFSFMQSKVQTFELVAVLSQIVSAHMLHSMRSAASRAPSPQVIAAGSSPSSESSSSFSSLFSFWSQELVRSAGGSGSSGSNKTSADAWPKEHNLRFLLDQLCRCLLLFTDWASPPSAVAKADVMQSDPALKMLFNFLGQQAVATAVAAAGPHSSVAASMGTERRGGLYLERGGVDSALAAMNPFAAGAAAAAAAAGSGGGGGAGVDEEEDHELSFPFEATLKPPKAILDSMVPPESLLHSFGGMAVKELVARHPYVTLAALLEETLADRQGWLRLGHMLSRWEANVVLKVHLKKAGVTDERVRRNCVVRRWFHAALTVPADHPLLPLFWQMAFRLLFSRLHLKKPMPTNLGGFFGFRFLTGTSGRQLMQQCRDHLNVLVTLTSKRRADAIQNQNARGGATLHPSVYELPALFQAMVCWLTDDSRPASSGGNVEPATSYLNSLRERVMGFGVALHEKYQTKRLATILLPPANRNVPLWWDLVDLLRLRAEVVGDVITALPKGFGAELLPTPRFFAPLLPVTPDLQAHTFFHRYYITQNYHLARYAPTPAQVVALLKRRAPHELSSSGNPFADGSALSESEARSLCSAAEYASTDVAKVPPSAAEAAAAHKMQLPSLLGPGASGGSSKRRKNSMGYWNSSLSPQPPAPVLSGGADLSLGGAHASLAAGGSSLTLRVPSVLTASLWDLLNESDNALTPLVHATRVFSERYSRSMALDRQLLDFLPSLYRNEHAQHVQVQSCRVGVMGYSHCRTPVHFLFKFTRAFKLRQVAESIDHNRGQALQCTAIDLRTSPATVAEEISLALCGTLIAIQRLLHHIVLVAAQPVRGEAPLQPHQEGAEGGALMPGGPGGAPARGGGNVNEQDQWTRAVVQAGLRWLFSLVELDSAVTSLFPPAQHFVQVSVASLTPLLTHPYLQSVQLQERVLDVLPRHPKLLPTLTASLRPEVAADPQAYLNLIRLALQVREENGVTSVRVLRRFDISRWLAQEPMPPLAARLQLLALCTQQLREEEKRPYRRPGHPQYGSPVSAMSDALCSVYADMMASLVHASLTDTFAPYLRVLLEELRSFGAAGSPFVPLGGSASVQASGPPQLGGPAHAPIWLLSLWRVLSTLPLHTLEWSAITQTAQQIEACLWEVRRLHSAQVEQLLAQKPLPPNQPPVMKQSNVRLHALLGDLLPLVVQFYSSLFGRGMHPSAFPQAAHDSASNACVSYASSDAKKRAAWNCVWQCFSAFCAPDPPALLGPGEPAAAAAAAAMPPSHPFLDAQQQTMLAALVSCMSSLSSGSRRDDRWVMAAFWHTYTQMITVNAEAPFLAMLHTAVVAHTRVHKVVDPAAEAAAAAEDHIAPFRPIPSPPTLDWHASWRLTSADLMSFTHTLRQAIELHERELTALMAAEQSRRDVEHAQQAAQAKGSSRRQAKLQPPVPVTRQDVRLMSQASAKVGHVASFVSHLIAAADWAFNLQPQPQRPQEQRALAPPGVLEPAPLTNPYELYAASPAGEYASTLLLSLVTVLVELPVAPFNAPRPSSATASSSRPDPVPSLLLPHVQTLFDIVLRLDWTGILLVRLPVEAFEMRLGRLARERHARAMAQIGGGDEPELLQPIEGDMDDGPASALPAPDEAHAMGLSALDREVGAAQTLLEQVSEVLYSERGQARIIEEVHFRNITAPHAAAAAAAASSPASAGKQSLLSSLLSNPFAALLGASASPSLNSPSSVERDAAAAAGGASGALVSPRSPNAPPPPLTDADVYGLVRPAFHRASGSLIVRFIHDELPAASSTTDHLSTHMTRVFFVFRLLSRVCGPQPPALFLSNQSSVTACHFFLPLVVQLRKARLYAEWLLSVFHGDAAPRPLMHESQYLSVASSLLSELDGHHDAVQRMVGDHELIPFIQEYLFVANLDSRGVAVTPAVRALTQRIFASEWPQLTLLAFTASCRSIVSLVQLGTFLESTLHAWLLTHGLFAKLHGARVSHWQVVASTVRAPEISFDKFVESCVNNGCILTLHVVALQQLMTAGDMLAIPPADDNPLVKHIMPQPRTDYGLLAAGPGAAAAAAAAGGGLVAPALSPLLDAKQLQQRIEQLLHWLQKVQVKDTVPSAAGGSSGGRPSSGSNAGAGGSSPSRPSPKHALVADEDVEPVKLLVALRTLLEWQGAVVAAYLAARNQPAHQCVQPAQAARWSNPLLANLRVHPDPYPLLSAADAMLDGLQQLLLRWLGDMRSSGGMLGRLGMSHSHRFSPRFRILLRALHTFLLLHVQQGSSVAALGLASDKLKAGKAPALHFAWSADASGPQGGSLTAAQRTALIAACTAQLSASKAVAAHSGTLRVVAASIAQAADRERYTPDNPAQSTFVPLLFAHTLIDQLVACVFPELQ